MTLATVVGGYADLFGQVANSALRTLVLGAGAGLGLAVLRVKSASVRLLAWTAVMYAALAMPLLAWILPSLPAPVPDLSWEHAAKHAVVAQPAWERESAVPEIAAVREAPGVRTVEQRTWKLASSAAPIVLPTRSGAVRTSRSAFLQWSAVFTATYVAVALGLLFRLAVGMLAAGRLERSAKRILDRSVRSRVAAYASAFGVSWVPQVAESDLISVPVTLGAFRPAIVLPAGWRSWDDAKLDAVVAHEVSHVARRDGFTQRLALLHRAIFWFSPLAWWLNRTLADLAEQASDEAVLSSGADCADYARTLLGFFGALHSGPGRVRWQGVSMATAGQAEQRVERILAWRGAVTMGIRKTVVVAVIAVAVPIVYVAAAVRPANHAALEQRQAPPPPAAPVAGVVAPAAPVALVTPPAPAGGVSGAPAVAFAPVAPSAPVVAPAAMAPPAPPAWRSGQSAGAGSSYSSGSTFNYDYDDESRFVIVSGKTDSVTMSGSSEDARHAQRLKKKIAGDFIWFERDEKSYIIRDQATIDRARKLWAPQEELGKKQEALGKQQEALGKQQEELGARMEQVRVKVPDMTAELDKLKAELKQLSSGATMDQVGRIQSEIGELQSKIGEIQSHAGEAQSKLGEEMGALGEKQGKLGEQQGELGRQQGELAEQAAREMRELLDEAIQKGTAQPEPQAGDGGTI